ncbi:hypothetical protein HKD37_02G004454 [Glycine soja]
MGRLEHPEIPHAHPQQPARLCLQECLPQCPLHQLVPSGPPEIRQPLHRAQGPLAHCVPQSLPKEKDSPRSQHQNGEDLSCNTCWTDAECDDTQGSMEGVKVKQETNSIGEIVRTDESNLEEDVAVSRDYQGSSVEGEKDNEELESRSRSSQIEKLQEVVCVERGGSKEESPNVEAEDVKEIPRNVNKEPAQAS